MSGTLVDTILAAIRSGNFIVSRHGARRLRQRKIPLVQIEDETLAAERAAIQLRVNSKPNPTIMVELVLADGTPVVAIWSWMKDHEAAQLVTVYFPD